MFLLILSAVLATYIFLRLTSVRTYFRDVSRFPPQVPSLLAGYDSGLHYALNPCGFLSRCQYVSDNLTGYRYKHKLGSDMALYTGCHLVLGSL